MFPPNTTRHMQLVQIVSNEEEFERQLATWLVLICSRGILRYDSSSHALCKVSATLSKATLPKYASDRPGLTEGLRHPVPGLE